MACCTAQIRGLAQLVQGQARDRSLRAAASEVAGRRQQPEKEDASDSEGQEMGETMVRKTSYKRRGTKTLIDEMFPDQASSTFAQAQAAEVRESANAAKSASSIPRTRTLLEKRSSKAMTGENSGFSASEVAAGRRQQPEKEEASDSERQEMGETMVRKTSYKRRGTKTLIDEMFPDQASSTFAQAQAAEVRESADGAKSASSIPRTRTLLEKRSSKAMVGANYPEPTLSRRSPHAAEARETAAGDKHTKLTSAVRKTVWEKQACKAMIGEIYPDLNLSMPVPQMADASAEKAASAKLTDAIHRAILEKRTCNAMIDEIYPELSLSMPVPQLQGAPEPDKAAGTKFSTAVHKTVVRKQACKAMIDEIYPALNVM